MQLIIIIYVSTRFYRLIQVAIAKLKLQVQKKKKMLVKLTRYQREIGQTQVQYERKLFHQSVIMIQSKLVFKISILMIVEDFIAFKERNILFFLNSFCIK